MQSKRQALPIILIVDDEESVRFALERQLRDLAIVVHAESGERALEIAHQVRINLVVSDYEMPALDGLVLLQQMASQFPDTRRILVSSTDLSDQAKGVVEAYLKKPWEASELRQMIRSLLSSPPKTARPQAAERRRARRTVVPLRATYSARGLSPCQGESLDLSREGTRIRGDMAVKIGDLVDLVLEREGGSEVIGVAQVVWISAQQGDSQFGVRFLQFREAESRQRLAHWLGD